jgi:hypothetical protein
VLVGDVDCGVTTSKKSVLAPARGSRGPGTLLVCAVVPTRNVATGEVVEAVNITDLSVDGTVVV